MTPTIKPVDMLHIAKGNIVMGKPKTSWRARFVQKPAG